MGKGAAGLLIFFAPINQHGSPPPILYLPCNMGIHRPALHGRVWEGGVGWVPYSPLSFDFQGKRSPGTFRELKIMG